MTGTVLVEGKSGYGLDTANEMKMLQVLERAKKELPIDISSTFCGAHAVPRSETCHQLDGSLANLVTGRRVVSFLAFASMKPYLDYRLMGPQSACQR